MNVTFSGDEVPPLAVKTFGAAAGSKGGVYAYNDHAKISTKTDEWSRNPACCRRHSITASLRPMLYTGI